MNISIEWEASECVCVRLLFHRLLSAGCNFIALSAKVISVADTIPPAPEHRHQYHSNEYINIHQCSFEHVHQAISYAKQFRMELLYHITLSHTHHTNSHKSRNTFRHEANENLFFNFGIHMKRPFTLLLRFGWCTRFTQ